jgi:hypothetical protein
MLFKPRLSILREEQRLKLFETKVVRRIFGTKKEKAI